MKPISDFNDISTTRNVTANFFNAPYHLHCYREPPKAGLADSGGLVSLSFLLVDLPDRLICFRFPEFLPHTP